MRREQSFQPRSANTFEAIVAAAGWPKCHSSAAQSQKRSLRPDFAVC